MVLILRSRSFLFSGALRRCLRVTSVPACSAIRRDYASQGSSKVRIGCASGFWGDSAVAAPQLINNGNLDFLVFDYLSEITMSLLTAAKTKSPDMGYAPDFVQAVMAPFLGSIKKTGVRVISNAGGINPQACAAALNEVATKAGIKFNIAVVTGDDLLLHKNAIQNAGTVDMYSKAPFPEGVNSMTAYLGAGPIAQALDAGADVVITGRCTDSALVLAPLVHTFNWSWDNYDLLAMGSLAGHLIECGAQVTGGNFTDWRTVPDWHNIGFPIVEVSADGSFVVSKPGGTGGLVTPATCAEQMIYEIGDPKRYVLPDVIADFSNVTFTPVEGKKDRVAVSGAVGKPPTSNYKVCATYEDGYRLTAVFSIGGPSSIEKARKTVDSVVKRVKGIHRMLKMEEFRKVHIQVIGAEDTYGKNAATGPGPREAVCWLAVHHNDRRALQLLAREIAPAGTGMAPGLCGIVGGRPKVSPIFRLFSFLYPKEDTTIYVDTNKGSHDYHAPKGLDYSSSSSSSSSSSDSSSDSDVDTEVSNEPLRSGEHSFRLEDLAYTRSGDKGNNCNIGVIARHPSYVPYLRAALTPESVDTYMSHVFEDRSGTLKDRVTRYEVPGVHGFNFVLYNSLGGGGVASLRNDPQGKAFGQMLLDFTIDNVPDLIEEAK